VATVGVKVVAGSRRRGVRDGVGALVDYSRSSGGNNKGQSDMGIKRLDRIQPDKVLQVNAMRKQREETEYWSGQAICKLGQWICKGKEGKEKKRDGEKGIITTARDKTPC
jgi:hypothetical protein